MPICDKCHTRLSKKKCTRHKKNCIPTDAKKGMQHFTASKSFAVDEAGNRVIRK